MTRRLAREIAMKTLFACDLGNDEPDKMIIQLCKETQVSPSANTFGSHLVQGVLTHQLFLDDLIKKYAHEWDLARMASVDRNILRMALFEMIFLKEIPVAVTINEALEIAKIYSTEAAPRFINGILGKVIQDLPKLKESCDHGCF
ncbi:MAG TPA: transcription antitermination factor NusB [Clostridia bacterium]|nr:transcription antitermination factor NusB [Clostridia bacterium]HHY05412.1 transcription antitermination factor NusB [Clostridia bacterium]